MPAQILPFNNDNAWNLGLCSTTFDHEELQHDYENLELKNAQRFSLCIWSYWKTIWLINLIHLASQFLGRLVWCRMKLVFAGASQQSAAVDEWVFWLRAVEKPALASSSGHLHVWNGSGRLEIQTCATAFPRPTYPFQPTIIALLNISQLDWASLGQHAGSRIRDRAKAWRNTFSGQWNMLMIIVNITFTISLVLLLPILSTLRISLLYH